MPTNNKLAKFAAALALGVVALIALPQTASAQDSGEFRFLFGGTRNYTTVQHPMEVVTVGSIHGIMAITSGDAEPFMEEDMLHGECAVMLTATDEGSKLEAPCAVSDDEGNQLFLVAEREEGSTDVGGGGQGAFRLIGGTGKFAGVSGSCPYRVHYMEDDDVMVFSQVCTWEK